MTGSPTLLAFDTSTSIGSVALGRGPEILARGFITRKGEHAARLVPEIERVMASAGVARGDIDGLVVGRGPGSFTGVRIAAATAKGLVRGLDCPVWLHSSLAAGAASVGARVPVLDLEGAAGSVGSVRMSDARPRYVLFDARGDRLYVACYRFADGDVLELEAPRASSVSELLESGPPADALLCGDGALRHRDAFAAAGYAVLGPPAGIPTAEGLLDLQGRIGGRSEDVRGTRWEPEYLRPSSAERPAAGSRAGP